MERAYTISYKTYFNERLKPVPFHGQEMHPLYIQVIFDRKPIYFKSYFFDLLVKKKYNNVAHESMAEAIVRKEERLLEFLSDLQSEAFSLEQFKIDYQFYSRDLLDLMDKGFKDYMYIFFFDEGKPELSLLVKGVADLLTPEGLMDTFKENLKPALYNKLAENAAYYAPPYPPFHAFARKRNKDSFTTFSVFEWQNPGTENEFADFLKKGFPDYDFGEVKKYIAKLLSL